MSRAFGASSSAIRFARSSSSLSPASDIASSTRHRPMAGRFPKTSSQRGSSNHPSLPRSLDWLLWFGGLAIVTAAMLPFRDSIEKAHVALVYLLIVLGASSRSGRTLGLTLAVTAFFSLNFFFVLPFYNVIVAKPLDWLELPALLLTLKGAPPPPTGPPTRARGGRNLPAGEGLPSPI